MLAAYKKIRVVLPAPDGIFPSPANKFEHEEKECSMAQGNFHQPGEKSTRGVLLLTLTLTAIL